MRADDLLRRAVYDELHDRALAASRQRRLHRPEVGLVDLDLGEALKGLGLRQPDRAEFRRSEHDTGDRVVANCATARAEQPVGERMALTNRNRAQVNAISDIPNRMDGRHGAGQILIDLHRLVRAEREARRLDAEAFGVGRTAGRHQDLIGVDYGAVRKHDAERAASLPLDAAWRAARA